MSNEAGNIAAYTAPTSPYPPYLSINRTAVGNVTISLRSPADGSDAGCFARIELWPEDWAELKRQILKD